ncbi:hypothetical protein OFN63_35730, partial [Escherichia coli]|nr:hypothetical protein [Escherichia coli]
SQLASAGFAFALTPVDAASPPAPQVACTPRALIEPSPSALASCAFLVNLACTAAARLRVNTEYALEVTTPGAGGGVVRLAERLAV